jgi:hypothetical protein
MRSIVVVAFVVSRLMRSTLVVTFFVPFVAAAVGCVAQIGGESALEGRGSSGAGSATGGSPASSTVDASSAGSGGSVGPGGGGSGGSASGHTDASSDSIDQADAGPDANQGIPCDVANLLAARCDSCHSQHPVQGAPMALVSYANLIAPSIMDPTKTYAEQSVVRMQISTPRMPPAPAAPATASEIAILTNWIAAGYPTGTCGVPDGGLADGGTSTDASLDDGNTYDGGFVCTSGKMYSHGTGADMEPGENCLGCHKFHIAGTIFPTLHEPDKCDGVNVGGVSVVITDSKGVVTTLAPSVTSGNFHTSATFTPPYNAKVIFNGVMREMLTPQTSGACNSCHTATGANGAPGRIQLP